MKGLEQDAQLKQAKALKADGGLSEIQFHLLDITSSSSIKSLADHLKQTHGDGIDFVINNAGIAMDGFGKPSSPSLRREEIKKIINIYRCQRCQNHAGLQLLQNP